MMRPAIATVAIFTFIQAWNENDVCGHIHQQLRIPNAYSGHTNALRLLYDGLGADRRSAGTGNIPDADRVCFFKQRRYRKASAPVLSRVKPLKATTLLCLLKFYIIGIN